MTKAERIKELEAIESQLLELDKQDLEAFQKIESHKVAHGGRYFKLWKWQKKALEVVRTHNITLIVAANKIGKTGLAANIINSWALGYQPWDNQPSSLGIKPPVRIRISGEDFEHHVDRTVIPELKKYAEVGKFRTRKNSQGVETKWYWTNGSSYEFFTYAQVKKGEVGESWLGHAWWPDEPPPKKLWAAMSRGIFTLSGKVLMTMTPLTEAWVLDDLVLSGRSDVGVINGLTILDNEEVYKHDVKILQEMGL